MPSTQTTHDPRFDDIQQRIDAVRRRLHDNPGLVIVEPEDFPPDLRDDVPEEGMYTTEVDGTHLHEPDD